MLKLLVIFGKKVLLKCDTNKNLTTQNILFWTRHNLYKYQMFSYDIC